MGRKNCLLEVFTSVQQMKVKEVLLLIVYLIKICLLFKILGLHYSLFLTERYLDPPIISLANNLIGLTLMVIMRGTSVTDG